MPELRDRLQAALGAGYRVEEELGGGGMSRVFVAEDVELGRKVVVKVLPPEMAAGVNADRFSREIKLAASLQHPHIVPLLSAGHAEDMVWYTMPLIEGESLRAKLAREGELPVPAAVKLLRDVADALAYAHQHGVVHRDIKPDNVLMSGHHAVVTDFGVAKALSAAAGTGALTSEGMALGTPAYMAPEQAMAAPNIDHRADIYAFGAMAYEMLTGQPPFGGWSPDAMLAAHVTETPDPVTRRRAAVPAALALLVMRCLEKKPADRWQSAAELHTSLEVMATPSGGLTPTTARRSALAPLAERRWMRIAAALVAVAVVALGGTVLWRTAKPRGPALDPNLVAVLPFRVAGADPSLHYLRQGMLDLMVAKLTGEGGPRAADVRSVLAAIRSVADTGDADLQRDAALKVAQRIGAGRILEGSVVGPPDHVVISASLTDAVPAATPRLATVEGPKDSLFVLVDRLAAQLLALGAGASAQLSSVTTTSLDALRAYLDGMAAYRRGSWQDAARLFERAVQLDSAFALAANGVAEAAGWGADVSDFERPRRLAWRYRDRLSDRDRALVTTRIGSRYPRFTPANVEIADHERLTQLMPESPEAWYFLGDELFHFGLTAGIPDARRRAEDAFRRALERDPYYVPALTHLGTVVYERGDTAELARLVPRLLAIDSTDELALLARWHLVASRRDGRAIAAFVARLDSVDLREVLFLSAGLWGDSVGVSVLGPVLHAMWRRATPEQRRGVLGVAGQLWELAVEAGRPEEAAAWLDSMATSGGGRFEMDCLAIIGWHQGVDSVAAESAARRMEALSSGPPPFRRLAPWYSEIWRLSRGDLASVDRTVQRLRSDPSLADTVSERHLLLAQVLEAWAAVLRRSPRARQLVDAADSLALGRYGWAPLDPMKAQINPIVAALYAQLGARDRALAAVRRRLYSLSLVTGPARAETARIEGLLAAEAGDQTGAIAAYRAYLMYRINPEQSKIPQRDSVRAELARLEGGR